MDYSRIVLDFNIEPTKRTFFDNRSNFILIIEILLQALIVKNMILVALELHHLTFRCELPQTDGTVMVLTEHEARVGNATHNIHYLAISHGCLDIDAVCVASLQLEGGGYAKEHGEKEDEH